MRPCCRYTTPDHATLPRGHPVDGRLPPAPGQASAHRPVRGVVTRVRCATRILVPPVDPTAAHGTKVRARYLNSFQNAAPTLRWRPDFVHGMPVARDTRRLAFVMPS